MFDKALSPFMLYTPLRCGKSIKSAAHRNILIVYSRLHEENLQNSINRIVEEISRFTDVSQKKKFFVTPGKK